jgi:general stress protein YciG
MAGRQGFASMRSDKRREIAAKGGRSVPASARTFTHDREAAAAAGRLGAAARKAGRARQASQLELEPMS